MKKYQVVVLRSLKGFGQFVTESRDEVNTYEFGDGDERPVIFGEKLKAVERRTIMKKIREVLGVKCWLTTHKKGKDAGISGLCMSCPGCVLFGGTYAPKKGGASGDKNVIEMRRVFYTAAFPFQGGGIRDVTFNAVDERTGQTGQALGTNQIIEPRDFIDIITVEADDDKWVKLLIWGIEHSDRYGANTRIYGEIHNRILGILEDTRIKLAALDLAKLGSIEKVKEFLGLDLKEKKDEDTGKKENTQLELKPIACGDSDVEEVIWSLVRSPEVEDLARRKNRVDLSVADYFKTVAEKWDKSILEKEIEIEMGKGKKQKWDKWNVDIRLKQINPAGMNAESAWETTKDIKIGPPQNGKKGTERSTQNLLAFLGTEYGKARIIETAIFTEGGEEEESES